MLKMEFGPSWTDEEGRQHITGSGGRTVAFYDLCEDAAPPNNSLRTAQRAFDVPDRYLKGEFDFTRIYDWATALDPVALADCRSYLALDVLGTAYLFGKMTYDRQTSFQWIHPVELHEPLPSLPSADSGRPA